MVNEIWNNTFGKKLKAQLKARISVEIKGDDKCEKCGELYSTSKRLLRHHDDYNKPLEVRLLCDKCHNEWHKYNKALL